MGGRIKITPFISEKNIDRELLLGKCSFYPLIWIPKVKLMPFCDILYINMLILGN